MKAWHVGLVGMGFTLGLAHAQAPLPLGDEFQVNTYTTGRQMLPSVGMASGGNFVVVWHSDGSDGNDTSGYSIQGKRYDSSGETVGGEFQVNSYTTLSQKSPAVAVGPQGNFVAVWQSRGSYGSDTDKTSIQAQRYDTTGQPVGGQFQVNSYTAGIQWSPAVAMDLVGNFVAVWESEGSYGNDTSGNSIQGQRYNSSGAPVGSEFQVNSYTSGVQYWPEVAADPQGGFVVAWTSDGSYGSDSSSVSAQAQLFDSSGVPAGGQFQVNSYTTSRQRLPAVAVDSLGNFVVAWRSDGSYGNDTSGFSIQGQRYNSSGETEGGEFQVNSYTTSYQAVPALAMNPQGHFVVVWHSDGSHGNDTSGYSIQGQIFDSSGAPVGGEFQVNSYSTSNQAVPAVASSPDGNLVVVWESEGSFGSDTDSWSVQGQRYLSPTIFTDSFESGDTGAWSRTVP